MKEFDDYCRSRENELRKIFPDFKIETVVEHSLVPPLDTAIDQSIVKFTQEVAQNSTWDTVAYAAEAGQFAEGGFESIICGPGSIEQAHRANEFIAKDELVKGVEMIRRIVQKLS